MKQSTNKWLLLALLAMLLLPWLGDTLFNTKGEPREAIVAVSMLNSGNWILPVSYGADIPYKPPFLAWLIAAFAWLFNGGIVNEYISRLPSALAAIAMVMGGYCWAVKRMSQPRAWAMALITITSFEVFRAAVACRVDMVLTACMVLALYIMYEWREKPGLGLGRLALITLLLCGAVLTKGPVGALLPCLAMGIYCLLQRDNFWRTLGWLSAVCVASMIIPALWYFKAYELGGDEFMRLAIEENIGRLTGTMTYESHINPWYYNLVTLVAGMLPWTVAAIVAGVCWLCRRGWQGVDWRKRLDPVACFAVTVSLTVLIFYCLPASKRSVYLLPMYPFMALGMAAVLERACRAAVSVQKWLIAVASVLATLAGLFLAIVQPAGLPIASIAWWRIIILLLPLNYVVFKWKALFHNDPQRFTLQATALLYLCYAGAFQPIILNAKTNLSEISTLNVAQHEHGQIYSHISYDPLMRYYIADFYLNDTLRKLNPEGGAPADRFCVIADPKDAAQAIRLFPDFNTEQTQVMAKSADTRKPMMLVKFTRNETR